MFKKSLSRFHSTIEFEKKRKENAYIHILIRPEYDIYKRILFLYQYVKIIHSSLLSSINTYTLITKIFLYENRSFSLGIDIIKVEFLLSKSIVYLHRKKKNISTAKNLYLCVILLYFVLYLNSASEECLLFGFIFRELILFTLESIFRLCRFENNKKNTHTHTHEERRNLSCSHIYTTTFFAIDDKLQRSKIKYFIEYIFWVDLSFSVKFHVQKWAAKKYSLDES